MGISAASFFCQVAALALVPDMFCNFFILKNRKIANNLAPTVAREKVSTDFETLEF
jgi:hypothetical protein